MGVIREILARLLGLFILKNIHHVTSFPHESIYIPPKVMCDSSAKVIHALIIVYTEIVSLVALAL